MESNRISAAGLLSRVNAVPKVTLWEAEVAPYLVPAGQEGSLLVRIRNPQEETKSVVSS